VLRALDPARARNLLRWFLRERGLPAPSSARLAEMLRQVAGAKRDARTTLVHAGVELGVHRGRLRVHGCAPEPFAREWSGARAVELAHGTLVFAPAQGTGIAARLLDTSRVTIRNGVPGERLRPSGRAARRAVADLLREAGIPRWDRVARPRVYCGDVLAAVAEAGVDSAFAAAPGEPAFALEWRPRQHCV
jgi:tRNA(Ile)-lysidine synthase